MFCLKLGPASIAAADSARPLSGAHCGRAEKALLRLISGRSDRNFRFADLQAILARLGFSCRIRGDHFIFSHPAIEEIINLQPVGSLAKPYQIKQVRGILMKSGMAGEGGDVQV